MPDAMTAELDVTEAPDTLYAKTRVGRRRRARVRTDFRRPAESAPGEGYLIDDDDNETDDIALLLLAHQPPNADGVIEVTAEEWARLRALARDSARAAF